MLLTLHFLLTGITTLAKEQHKHKWVIRGIGKLSTDMLLTPYFLFTVWFSINGFNRLQSQCPSRLQTMKYCVARIIASH